MITETVIIRNDTADGNIRLIAAIIAPLRIINTGER